jgi:hypothetical protein
MENENVITLDLPLTRRNVVFILAVFFLCWHPRFLGSETLVLTTFYPAPYVGYSSLLTTCQTELAKNTSFVVMGSGYNATNTRRNATVKLEAGGDISTTQGIRWGINNKAALTTDQGGSIELGGAGGTPYIGFNTGSGPAKLWLPQAGRLAVEGDFSVTGVYVSACTSRAYGGGTTTCPVNTQVLSYYGDGVVRVTGTLPVSAAATTAIPFAGTPVSLGRDWFGTMFCCKFEY